MQTGDTWYIYQNTLDEVCFQHDMAYGSYRDLVKRAEFDNVLRDKAYKVARDQWYDGYQRGLASMVYKFFYKESAGSTAKSIPNQQLADELRKPIIRKFKRCKVYSSFQDDIWGADLVDMQLLSYNKCFKFLLCVIDLFSKYAWVVALKDKKGFTIVNAFQSILNGSWRKPSKLWVGQGSEFYN